MDPAIGVYVIDRFTYYALDFLEKVEPTSSKTLGEFVSIVLYYKLEFNNFIPFKTFKTFIFIAAQNMSKTLLFIYSWYKKRFI